MTPTAKTQQTRINERIRVPQVRLVGEDGEQIGVVDTKSALQMAYDKGLDLVEVAPTARPPVCKIMDYGRFKYEQTKKTKQSKKKQHHIQIKEVQFRPSTEKHDYEFKRNHLIKFLEHGDKVKVLVLFRGRELVHQNLGEELMKRLVADLKETAIVESPPKLEGRALWALFAPAKAAKKSAADGDEDSDDETEETTA